MSDAGQKFFLGVQREIAVGVPNGWWFEGNFFVVGGIGNEYDGGDNGGGLAGRQVVQITYPVVGK